MSEWTIDAALLTLTALLEHIDWYQPIRETQAEAMRASAIYVRDTVDASPNPGMDDLALVGCMDACLDWLLDPEDKTRIDRVRRSWDVYSELYDLVDGQ